MKEGVTRKYTNGEVTVVWKPDRCIHSTNCFRGLPEVFDPRKRPWVNMAGAGTDQIVSQVSRCPSGALSTYANADAGAVGKTPSLTCVEVTPDGPLVIHGDISVRTSDGRETRRSASTLFCRCGGSSNKPWCDSTHRRNGFRG